MVEFQERRLILRIQVVNQRGPEVPDEAIETTYRFEIYWSRARRLRMSVNEMCK